MRKALVSLFLVALLLVGADLGLRLFAEFWVGRELRESLDLPDRPDVDLGGFPFLVHLVSASFPAVGVAIDGYEDGSLRIRRTEIELRDVDIPRSQLLSGSSGEIRAASGEGRALLTGPDVTAAFRSRGAPLTVSFRGSRAFVGVEGLGEVEADVSLDGRSVVLAAADLPQAAYAFPLPAIVEGLRYRDVRVEQGMLVITVSLDEVRFRVPSE
ncbi:MAG: DUF2993 domain-containing protein [Actinobacteria bacterium]|nr:DUF2993 domain-containing protein [Actinomycetota bacterium]